MIFFVFSKNRKVKIPPQKTPKTKYQRILPLHIRNISEKMYKLLKIQKIKSSIDIQNNVCFTILLNNLIAEYTRQIKFPVRQADKKIENSLPIPSIQLT